MGCKKQNSMKRIFLIGFMGSGKTTVGKLLAQKLEFSFIDLDQYIENRLLKNISTLFTEGGEDSFRAIEHKLLLEVAQIDNVVVSTGGGTACFHNNMEIMNEAGISIYLKISHQILQNRLQKAKEFRPLIKDKTDQELFAFILEALQKREKYYQQASLIVSNNEPEEDAENSCNKIIKALKTPA